MQGSEASGDAAGCVYRLSKEGGRVHLWREGDSAGTPVKIVYLRPLSSRSEIAFFDDDAQEICTLASLDELEPASRELVRQQLAERYHLPRINQVKSIETLFGTHYWKVETDKGSCHFALKEPGKNITHLDPDHIVLCDTIGNRYEIASLAELDTASRREIRKIL